MALEVISGKLSDFGGGLDTSQHPRIKFQPNGPAVGADGVFLSAPVYVDTFTGSSGAWSVQLEGTDALWRTTGGDVFYIVTLERTPPGGVGFPTDRPGWTLRVPPGGGEFAALVRAPTNPAQIWIGPEPPYDPTPYTGWYKTDALPGEPNYFEWE